MPRLKVKQQPIPIQIDDFSLFSESFRALKINIRYSTNEHNIQSIAITSANTGEGKTTAALHLAKSYADAGKEVVLVDASLRNPGVHHVFNRRGVVGLTEYLSDSSVLVHDIVHFSGTDHISTVCAGKSTAAFNSSDLLASDRMDELLAELKQRFDIVIVDTPPLLQLVDAKIMSAKCDGVLLIATYGKLKKNLAKKANSELMKVKANVLGVVFNKV